MTGVGKRYLYTVLIILLFLPCKNAYAAEAESLPSEDEAFFLEEKWGLESLPSDESVGDLLERLKNAKTIENPRLERTYQEGDRRFTYTLPNQMNFRASVPDGAMTDGPVTFLPMKSAYVTVTRNGMMEKVSEDGVYTSPGNYVFSMMVFPEEYQGTDMNSYRVPFEFQILPDVVSSLTLYVPPEGFYITGITFDGEDRAPENPEWEFIHRDGSYTVRMLDQETGTIPCEASFTRDTTAPFLFITPEQETDVVKEPIMISVSEPGASIQAFYNGSEGVLVSNVISTEGRYEFYVSDAAGNSRYYILRMKGRVKGPERKTIILTIIGVAGVLGFLIYQRRHMRFL